MSRALLCWPGLTQFAICFEVIKILKHTKVYPKVLISVQIIKLGPNNKPKLTFDFYSRSAEPQRQHSLSQRLRESEGWPDLCWCHSGLRRQRGSVSSCLLGGQIRILSIDVRWRQFCRRYVWVYIGVSVSYGMDSETTPPPPFVIQVKYKFYQE